MPGTKSTVKHAASVEPPLATRCRVDDAAEDNSKTVLRQVAAEQRASQLEQIISAMAEGLVFHTSDGVVAEANAAAEQILGLTRDELFGKQWSDRHWHSIREDGAPLLEEDRPTRMALRTGKAIRNHVMGILLPTGGVRWVRVNSVPIGSNGPQAYATVTTLTDITQLKQVELSLRENEQELRAVQRIAKIGNWRWDLRSDAHIWSETIYSIYGRDPTLPPARYPEVMGYFTPESWVSLAAAIEKCLADGLAYEQDAEVLRPDGTRRWIAAFGKAEKDGAGTIVVLHGVVQDITDRKQAEHALRTSKEDYRRISVEQEAILNTELFGIAKSRDRTITWANLGFEKMYGFQPGEAVGVSARQLYLHEETFRVLGKNADPVLKSGGIYSGQAEHLRRDGRPIWVALTGIMLDKESAESLWAFVDITERLRYEADLIAAKSVAERATQSKTRFLAAASHDLWQPVHAANLFHDALSKTDLDENQKRLLAKLAQSIDSVGQILRGLVEISRLDSGTITPRPERILAEDLFYWIDSIFSPVALAKGLRFKLHFSMREMAFFTDSMLLRSLLSNLISNAIRYTNKGGVLVGVRRQANGARIQVWDTGIGIASEHIDVIFDDYYQVGNPERDIGKGMGLGLSVVRHLSRLLATQVTVRSRLGRGSVFEFCLPLEDSERS